MKSVRGDGERISIGEIIGALDARAFGLATLIFSIPSLVPMPPGVPTVVGLALLVVSSQMVFGRRELWLPRILTKRSFPRAAIVNAFEKHQKRLVSIEKISKPRLLVLSGRLGTILIGTTILLMSIILILPLPPGGNFPPALACAIFGLGLAERDGVIILWGYLSAIIAAAAVFFVTHAFLHYLPGVAEWISRTTGL